MPKAPVLIYSFSACHRDWVTGCAWTKDNLLVREEVGVGQSSAGFLGEDNTVHLILFLTPIYNNSNS